MKTKSLPLLFLLTLFSFSTVFGQYEIKINAFVLDKETQEPISYVNVGFLGKGIGTVTNKSGRFYLQYDENKIADSDRFQISCIGYEPLVITQKQLFDTLENSNTISLKQLVYNTKETSTSIENSVKDSIGYASYHSNLLAYWKDNKTPGGEIASFIKVRKKNTKLDNLKFYIAENTTDSIVVRVNFYNIKGKRPENNFLERAIYHTITNKKGEEIIDVSRYNIKVDKDFIASIELVKVYGEDMQFAVSAGKGGYSFLRYTSQDKWEERKGVGVAFKIDVTYPAADQLEKRQKPEDIVLYWDTSLSMQHRNIDKDLLFLKEYISTLKNTTIVVVPFSNKTGERKQFIVKNGDSKDLLQMLAELKYDGGSNFSDLFKETDKPDQYLVFTDGYDTYGNHEFMYGTPVFYINSKEKANDVALQEGGFSSEGYYINLSNTTTQKAVTLINYDLKDSVVYATNQNIELVSGTVYSDKIPVQGCKVIVKGTLTEAITDKEGKFSLPVDTNQMLSFQHFNMISKDIIYDGSKNISVKLNPKYVNLSEVNLRVKKRKLKEKDPYYYERKAAFGEQIFTKEELPKNVEHLSDLIRRTLFKVNVIGFGLGAEFVSRRSRSSIFSDNPGGDKVLFVVDNNPQSQPPIFLQPSQIETIYFMPARTASIQYGGRGNNGAIVINTTYGYKIDDNYVNPLLVVGNDYKESTFLLDNNQNRPEYVNVLWNSTTYSSALETYYELRKKHKNRIPFYVYCAAYFKQWDKEFSKQIISNVAEIANDNYGALRTLAFLLEENKDIHKATVVYEKLLELKPEYAQSYLDIARIYKENKEYEKAFNIYKKILQDHKEETEFVEVRKQAESELRHLLNHHRSHVSYTDISKEFLTVKSVPVRIVFDWNDPQAEFEFQFVNPEKKYEKWTHRFEENKELFQKETKYGVVSKEFVVDESMLGEWIINVQSFEEESKQNPAFMKYTIYRNYGLAEETKTVKFIKLYTQKEKVTLDKFSI